MEKDEHGLYKRTDLKRGSFSVNFKQAVSFICSEYKLSASESAQHVKLDSETIPLLGYKITTLDEYKTFCFMMEGRG